MELVPVLDRCGPVTLDDEKVSDQQLESDIESDTNSDFGSLS